MIYIDTSVALARLFGEDRRPTDEFWSETLLSSRLLQYETWVRVNARGLAASHGDEVRVLLDGVMFIEMTAAALERALEPLPVPLRTLDAMHLATMDFLKRNGHSVRLAAASAMGFETLAL
jgi:predicted nucleic acid-binding protein